MQHTATDARCWFGGHGKNEKGRDERPHNPSLKSTPLNGTEASVTGARNKGPQPTLPRFNGCNDAGFFGTLHCHHVFTTRISPGYTTFQVCESLS